MSIQIFMVLSLFQVKRDNALSPGSLAATRNQIQAHSMIFRHEIQAYSRIFQHKFQAFPNTMTFKLILGFHVKVKYLTDLIRRFLLLLF